ncbi:hypothetical protein J2J97_31770 (plasmid) [Rhizobium bangladeshense]|uniref:hypothetical protein n=1 Tax=Rhizobium bangladeshense TaxID=1138189 RepID=UPI001A986762|nr:hypothetical protein [Rhizobium bangladeshense]QSY98650.1 hypothetical protein J2J97_31770 [Rhizobium bangladeshense]
MADLISLTDAKAGLPIRAGNSEFDAKLSELIAVVSQQIETACRRKFEAGTYSEIFHVQAGYERRYDFLSDTNTSGVFLAPSGSPITLTQAPLLENGTVKVYYDLTHRFTDDTELFADQFVVLREKNCIYINRPLAKSRDSLKVVYDGGFAEIPTDIKVACVMQVQHLFKRSQPENVSTSSDKDSKGKEEYTTKAGLLPEVANLIAPYRQLLRGRG